MEALDKDDEECFRDFSTMRRHRSPSWERPRLCVLGVMTSPTLVVRICRGVAGIRALGLPLKFLSCWQLEFAQVVAIVRDLLNLCYGTPPKHPDRGADIRIPG